jgi:hypothetical protein
MIMEWILKMIGLKQKIDTAHQKKNEYAAGMAQIQRASRQIQKHNAEILSITQSIAVATGDRRRSVRQ